MSALHAAAGGGEVFGVEEARKFFQRRRKEGADIQVSPYSLVERGDRVEVRG